METLSNSSILTLLLLGKGGGDKCNASLTNNFFFKSKDSSFTAVESKTLRTLFDLPYLEAV